MSRLLLVIVTSVILMFVDHRGHHLSYFRNVLTTFVTPLVYLVDVPSELFLWSSHRAQSRSELAAENKLLKEERFVLRTQLQKLISLKAENAQLRNLLGAEEKVQGNQLVAEILQVAPDPYTHELVINKGHLHDVFVGQAVLDAYGVMGQVIEVSQLTSRVLLITDPRHAIPVRSERSGERTIALGNGMQGFLTLQYVRSTADFQVGDLLLSSGIGQRFPDGYPVATITQIEEKQGQPYAVVEASTSAHLARTGHVLLIWPDRERSRAVNANEQNSEEAVNH
jgi:rod shape-determining protein MreC